MPSSEPPAAARSPRADAVLVGVLLAACLVAGASNVADPDMFHRLALGREIVLRGALPTHDPFAFTPTRTPLVDHEWLVAVVLYRVVAAWGAAGLLAVKWTLHGLTLGLVLLVAHRLGASPAVLAFLGPLGIGMSLPGMTTVRAQAFTLCFVAVTLVCLDDDRRGGRRWILGFVPLLVLWANCHAGWVVGAGLLGLHTVEQALRRAPVRHLVALLVLVPLVFFATPYGAAYPPALVDGLRMDRSMIGEWRRLGEGHALALPVWALSLLVFVYGWLPAGPRTVPGWLLVTVTAAAAYAHERHVSIYALVWLAHVPAMVEHGRLGRTFHRLWDARPAARRTALAVAIAAALLHAASARRWRVVVPNAPGERSAVAYPVGAVAYLRAQGFAGRLTTPFEQGAYVLWQLFPAVTVSLDSRFEAAYPTALVAEHVAFYAALPSWTALLHDHPSDIVLVRRSDPVVAHLEVTGTWRRVYDDDAFLLFARPGLALPYVDRRGEPIAGAFP